MSRVIYGYLVVFHRPQERESVRLSVEGGIRAQAAWSEGKPTLRLKGAMYSTKQIASIEPLFATGEYQQKKLLDSGKGMLEEKVDEQFKQIASGDLSHKQLTG